MEALGVFNREKALVPTVKLRECSLPALVDSVHDREGLLVLDAGC